MNVFYQGLSNWLGGTRVVDSLPALGAREIEVMKILWQHGELNAQQTLAHIDTDSLSLSTLQSTLERLFRKNLLKRRKQGRAYIYSAAISQSDVIGRLMGEIAAQLGNGQSDLMICGFMSYIDEQLDDEASEALMSHIEQKKRSK